jgi:N-acetylglucosamine-6-phosphate deacetylase
MSAAEIADAVGRKRDELADIQSGGKVVERELQEQRSVLAARKADLMSAVETRMELIEMLRRDIVRMANDESARCAQLDYDAQLPPLKP